LRFTNTRRQAKEETPRGAMVVQRWSAPYFLKSPNREKNLLNILDELSEEDFHRFKWFLKTGSAKHCFKVKEFMAASRVDVVDRMVQHYSLDEAVEVMKTTLRDIDKNDLVKRM
ncbi:hypothetical protein ILYODFUR_039113, partial [Ilyodon furcidens]